MTEQETWPIPSKWYKLPRIIFFFCLSIGLLAEILSIQGLGVDWGPLGRGVGPLLFVFIWAYYFFLVGKNKLFFCLTGWTSAFGLLFKFILLSLLSLALFFPLALRVFSYLPTPKSLGEAELLYTLTAAFFVPASFSLASGAMLVWLLNRFFPGNKNAEGVAP